MKKNIIVYILIFSIGGDGNGVISDPNVTFHL